MLTVEMRPNKCPRCTDVFYDFPKSYVEANSVSCILCGYYPYDKDKNSELKLFLEEN